MHAATPPDQPTREKDVAAWLVLIGAGITLICFNVWHATHKGDLALFLAVLLGLSPSSLAMGLSHMGVRHRENPWMMTAMFAVMVGAMGLSIGAVAAVVRPTTGPYLCWLFGAVLDSAALLALWGIISAPKLAERAALETAERAAADAAEATREAMAEAARLEAELGAANAALEAERQRRISGRKQRRSSARKPATTSARNRVPTSAPEVPVVVPVVVPPGSSAPDDTPDLDAEARILALISEGYSASKAGVLAGKSDSYGRQVARLAKAAQTEPAGGERTDGDMS